CRRRPGGFTKVNRPGKSRGASRSARRGAVAGLRQRPAQGLEVVDRPRAHYPRLLLAVAQQHQGRPQLHPEGAAERAALAVLDLDVGDVVAAFQQRAQRRLRRAAVPAPGRAEFQQQQPRRGLEFGPCRFARRELLAIAHAFSCGACRALWATTPARHHWTSDPVATGSPARHGAGRSPTRPTCRARVSVSIVALVLAWSYLRLRRSSRRLAEANAQLDHENAHGALTGIRNRLHFLRRFESLKSTAPGRAMLVLLDLDHFKGINDRFGHAAGADVPREVARRLAATMRDRDVVARWGG